MPEISVLAKKLRAYRKKQDLSQLEISGEIGISMDEVGLIEREIANPSLSTIQKIAAYMGVTVSELLKVEE